MAQKIPHTTVRRAAAQLRCALFCVRLSAAAHKKAGLPGDTGRTCAAR